MSKDSLKPSVRFKGFTDAWEQCKLSSLVNFYKGSGLSWDDISDEGKYPCILYGNLYTDYGMITDVVKFKSTSIPQNCFYGKIGDVLIPGDDTTPTGLARATSLEVDNVLLSGGINVLRPKVINGSFLSICINKNKSKLIPLITGTTVRHLNNGSLATLDFDVTLNNAEEKKIVSLFKTLDSLITLHQRKYDRLQAVKKGLLEKMFPSDDRDKPEIRFKDFTEVWEQCKFDEVVNRIATGLNPRDNFLLNSGGNNFYVTIKNFEHGRLYLDDDCDKIDDKALEMIQNRSDLQKDDILFSSIGRIGDCYLIKEKPENWNINESVFALRPNKKMVYPNYLFHVIHSNKVLNSILNDITGSTFKSIKITDLKNTIIPITNKDEQTKISNFLSDLDSLITLHQCKLEKLKNMKKALLEKMFC